MRIGVGLRESRIALALTQADASDRAGVSQGYWSRLERGQTTNASLETLAACAAAVDTELAAFLQARPGADLPRDIAHLRGQAAIIREAERGGWHAGVEVPIDPDARRSRSIDVTLERAARREIAVVELVDLIADAGQDMRGLSDKVAAVCRARPDARVAGVLAIRATRRNRALIAELAPLVDARFPASSAAWLRALHDPSAAMPNDDGVVWARVSGEGLFARRP
ncbi:MAG TPA: helix-turn-helix transcriptional regulator [Candidatus Limnocylindrales bacterium]|nr:helix-turn-helix transcriptional regulator [Candidatus Limnocylindrales bacterium]